MAGVNQLHDYDGPGERWEDIRFPVSGINPPGQVSDPDWDTTNGGWLFDASSTELVFVAAQLPHAWKAGSVLKPHVHWQKTTSASGTVLWLLEYKWSPIGDVMDTAFTELSSTTVSPPATDGDTANEHLVTGLGDLAATGKDISDMLMMKLSRVGGSDTYGADARMLEFDIHYVRDSRGSIDEFAKINALRYTATGQ